MLFFIKAKFPVLLFLPIDSCPIIGYHWQKSGSFFFTPPISIFYTDCLDSPWAFSSLDWTVLVTSLFPYDTCSKTLITFDLFQWTCWLVLRNISLDLPAKCFMQLWIMLIFFASRTYHWLMVTLLPTRTSESFSAKLLSNLSPPAFTVHGIIPPKERTWHFPFSEFYKIPLYQFLQPVEVTLHCTTTLCCRSYSCQVLIICMLV